MRSRVLAEWRGLPETPFPRDAWKPVSAVIEKVVAELGLAKRIQEEEILSAWREIAGDFIAQHSTPQRLVDGVLQVRVLQPAVAYELDRTFRHELLARLKERFGRRIRDIRFRIG